MAKDVRHALPEAAARIGQHGSHGAAAEALGGAPLRVDGGMTANSLLMQMQADFGG